MGQGFRRAVGALVLAILLGSAICAVPPSGTVRALSNFFVYVKDEKGAFRPDAYVTIRYRFGPRIWQLVTTGRTGVNGYATLQLDPAEDYVVVIYYQEFDLQETWIYGYIGAQDWIYSTKTFQRNRPWIEQVSMGAQPVAFGDSRDVTVTTAHGYKDTDYDFRVKVVMVIDDDGQTPYLSELTSDVQFFYNGIVPFHLSYTPTTEGRFLVRFIIYTKFEVNDWEVSDDGGWRWQIDVVDPNAPALVQGRVYQDLNHDGVYASHEPLIQGARLVLAQGEVTITEGETGSDGRYEFRVPAGSYQLRIGRAPYGYRVPVQRDITCAAGQTLQNVDWALETWSCYGPLFLAQYRP